jgi:hypothetical protein
MNQNTTKTRSKPARHNGHAGNDTSPLAQFLVLLALLKRTRMAIMVKAGSLNEAREQASRLARIVEKFNSGGYDEVTVAAVRPAKGGRRHA